MRRKRVFGNLRRCNQSSSPGAGECWLDSMVGDVIPPSAP